MRTAITTETVPIVKNIVEIFHGNWVGLYFFDSNKSLSRCLPLSTALRGSCDLIDVR